VSESPEPTAVPSAIVLTIEGLGAHYLQCYGNSSLATDGLNRLAAEGGIADFVFAESTNIGEIITAFWTGRHPLIQAKVEPQSLPSVLHAAGVGTVLLTDPQTVEQHPLAAGFGEVITFSEWKTEVAAESLAETYFAVRTTEILDVAAQLTQPFCLWVHLKGFNAVWDAPYFMREAFAAEEDPDPPEFIKPPTANLSQRQAWDERLGFQQTYFAQLAVLDECVGILIDAVQDAGLCLAVSSTGGYPLAEHGCVGGATTVFAEQTHVPLLWLQPNAESAGQRDHELSQSSRLFRLVSELFNLDSQKSEAEQQPVAISKSDNFLALRTPSWTLIVKSDNVEPTPKLFVRPDDRYEMNDIADLCIDEVEQLTDYLGALQSKLTEGLPSGWPALPAELTE
jgi:arylsulfatase A-like enzyme